MASVMARFRAQMMVWELIFYFSLGWLYSSVLGHGPQQL